MRSYRPGHVDVSRGETDNSDELSTRQLVDNFGDSLTKSSTIRTLARMTGRRTEYSDQAFTFLYQRLMRILYGFKSTQKKPP
jgi:hypothetical protein